MLINPTYTYLVIDLESQGILCKTPTGSVAHAVSLGFINSTTTILLEFPWSTHKASLVDFDNEDWLLMVRGEFIKMAPEVVPHGWVEKKTLALKRRNFQWAWEGRCVQQLKRASEFHSPGVFEAYALGQIKECDPESGKWSVGVLEWASIHNLSPETAYQELKLYMDSTGLMYLRNAAIYKKVMAEINKVTTEKEMNETFRAGMEAMMIGKSLL